MDHCTKIPVSTGDSETLEYKPLFVYLDINEKQEPEDDDYLNEDPLNWNPKTVNNLVYNAKKVQQTDVKFEIEEPLECYGDVDAEHIEPTTGKVQETDVKSEIEEPLECYGDVDPEHIEPTTGKADISDVKNLSVLYLQQNKLRKIENLHGNGKLTHLYLHNNKICKMENLYALTQLKKLYLGHNCISVVEGLDNLTNLEELHLESQQLALGETMYFDPRTTASLALCLRVLDISGNNIPTVCDLKEMRCLEKLDASNNSLSDLSLLCSVIIHWPKVTVLDFRGSLDGKDINDITRSFIQRFESIKEEREKLHKSALEKTLFSDEVASIAKHLPPELRQSISASVKKEAVSRSKSLTLSLMVIPNHLPGVTSDDSTLPSMGLQPWQPRKVTQAENLSRSRHKIEMEIQTSGQQIGDSILGNDH